MKPTVEIFCPHCGAEAFLNREPVYDGFKKTGEELSCSACGGRFACEEDVPFKSRAAAPKIFTDADRSQAVQVFTEGENRRICRYCANYVVNPFMQFCSHHKKEVQSTDSCARFSPGGEKPSDPFKGL
jgi:transcription elongation factor Elf1